MTLIKFFASKTGLTILFVLLTSRTFADVQLPAVFSDHMLLQRDMPLNIWGWADPQERVTVILAGKEQQTIAGGDKAWKTVLPPMPAGGPYELIVKGRNQLILTNILIGDVWICGGQSNMQYLMKWLGNRYDGEMAQAANPSIRLLTVNSHTSTVPLNDIKTAGWKEATPATVLNFSAVAYFFGKELNEKYKIPIGLISVNMGATPAEAWTSIEALQDFPHYTNRLEEVRRIENLYKANLKAWEEEMRSLYSEADTATLLTGDITSWKSIDLPGKWNLTLAPDSAAVIWFAREFDLPAKLATTEATLLLGRIDDNDIVYVNGHRVGGMGEYKNYHVPRAYPVNRNYLKHGKNRIMVRVTDRWLNGGLTGPENSMRIAAGGQSIPLAGIWQYKVISRFRIPSTPTFEYSIRTPAVLYNAMVHPLMDYGIKGAIWYQGEGNTSIAYEYRKLFPAMITDWRSRWKGGSFPFLFVQLANYMESSKEPQESEWAELREAQTMALLLPNTGMAVTIDIGEAADIHPKNKKDVGNRLALLARRIAYEKTWLPQALYINPCR
jgi:sialate O-acetylesterase